MSSWVARGVAVIILFGVAFAAYSEDSAGHLRHVCDSRVDGAFAACSGTPSPESRLQCAEALMDLELLEDNATIWRGQWVAAACVALVITALGPLLSCSQVGLFVTAFVTAFAVARAQTAYEVSHNRRLPRTSRMRLIRGMHGSSPNTVQYYY